MALPDETRSEDPRQAARRMLALRIAHRNRLRAERLARLRPEADPEADGAALEEFLATLAGACGTAEPAIEPPPAAVLPFQRPRSAGDLDRLPGMRPGLAWALERAGLARCADVAALDEAGLIARLGPLGRLVPARAWLAAARAAAAPD